MFGANLYIQIASAAVPLRPAKNDLRNTIRIAATLLYSALPLPLPCCCSTLPLPFPLPLLYFCSISTPSSISNLPLPLPLLYLYSALLYSSLLYAISSLALFCFTQVLGPALLYLYLTLPLLYPFSSSRRCELDTMIFGLLGM